MRAPLIAFGLTLTTSPALAAAPGQTLEPLQVSPVRDGRLFSPESSSPLLVPTTEIACGGQPIQPLYADDLALGVARSAGYERPAVVLAFSVDEQGRTRDIRPVRDAASPPSGPIVVSPLSPSQEEQAALAAWRFPAGPRADCRATIRYSAKPLEAATTDDLLRYFAVTRTRGALREMVARRLGGPDANCGGDGRGGRAARTVSVPDFMIGRRPPPGGRSWTVVRWNVDAEGRTTAVQTLGSSGDADLDREARRAISETVLRPGAPLTGCVFNFNRVGETLTPPDLPPREEDPQQSCPADISGPTAAEHRARAFSARLRHTPDRGLGPGAVRPGDLGPDGRHRGDRRPAVRRVRRGRQPVDRLRPRRAGRDRRGPLRPADPLSPARRQRDGRRHRDRLTPRLSNAAIRP